MDSALIGVVGALIGVLLTNALRLYLDWRVRLERIRDVQTALRAEIRSHRRSLEVFLDQGRTELVAERILSEPNHRPFVPREVEAAVFNAIVGEIHILPGPVIDPAVLYYRQWRTLAASIEDMREQSFGDLSAERKAALYRDHVAVGAYALALADDAIEAINASLGEGDPS